MIPNGKLVAGDGKQIAVFPSTELNITQGTNTNYSHRCTKNTDNAVRSGASRNIYAPVDMKCVANHSSAGYGVVIYHTIEEVYTARYGLTHFTLVMMHDNNASRWEVGKIYRQGEHIYTEGDADPSGLTTGIHVHYEVALGHTTTRTRSCENGYLHITPNQVYLDDIFFKNMTVFVKENATGQFTGDHVFNFLEWKGSVDPDPDPTPPSKTGDDMLVAMLVRAYPNSI